MYEDEILQDDDNISAPEKESLPWSAYVLIILALFSAIVSVVVFQVTPISDDLYNLVYAENNPAKVENTFIFLFFFPFLQSGLAFLYIARLKTDRAFESKGPLMVTASVCWMLVSLNRCYDAWEKFS